MKIIYSGAQFNDFNPKKGVSFEHVAFYEGLKALPGIEVVYFPFERIVEVGKRTFNDELKSLVSREKPDLFFAFMFSDEFDPEVLQEIKKETVTAAWFADDSWRFYNYSRRWAKYFSWAVTTYSWMPELYKKIAGQPNVIRSQWAADPHFFKPEADAFTFAEDKRPDVSFVGGWSKPREKIINALIDAGIKVTLYGGGWKNGARATSEEMIRTFSISKINLALNPPPGYFNKNSIGRLALRHSSNRIVPDFHLMQNFRSWLCRGIPQIKARHFEIPACGGFVMTGMADDLDNFYEIGKEMAVYENTADLIEKIKYYLIHPDERAHMARAGYERTIKDHTYEKRFRDLFLRMGLKIRD